MDSVYKLFDLSRHPHVIKHKRHPMACYSSGNTGADNLLMALGDSWTFGGSLDLMCNTDDYETCRNFRTESVFANKLSKHLECDWINIAVPSVSNFWIVNQLITLNRYRNQIPYKHLYVIITLTEFYRELPEILALDKYREMITQVTSVAELNQLLVNIVQDIILDNIPNDATLIVGRNYVNDHWPGLKDYSLPKSWLEVLTDREFDNNCYVMGMLGTNKLIEAKDMFDLTDEQFQTDMLDIFAQANQRINLLESCEFSLPYKHYRHPDPQGHTLWADYIYSEMQ